MFAVLKRLVCDACCAVELVPDDVCCMDEGTVYTSYPYVYIPCLLLTALLLTVNW